MREPICIVVGGREEGRACDERGEVVGEEERREEEGAGAERRGGGRERREERSSSSLAQGEGEERKDSEGGVGGRVWVQAQERSKKQTPLRCWGGLSTNGQVLGGLVTVCRASSMGMMVGISW